ncbi:hypothetical protein RF11_10742 [Thelohanellus kitauei]|uniref:Uncharacterized protein n=1 Tax=Thelohanellus kitauei TaxID=669202 RepID=A0A0C2N5D2_THEKT|nr:hypothetical protein RF11_10742 [Thelohanellus kitauei]
MLFRKKLTIWKEHAAIEDVEMFSSIIESKTKDILPLIFNHLDTALAAIAEKLDNLLFIFQLITSIHGFSGMVTIKKIRENDYWILKTNFVCVCLRQCEESHNFAETINHKYSTD